MYAHRRTGYAGSGGALIGLYKTSKKIYRKFFGPGHLGVRGSVNFLYGILEKLGKPKNYAASNFALSTESFKNFQSAHIGPMISTKKGPSLPRKKAPKSPKKKTL